jgi:L-ascorbate peroxidase
VKLLDKSNAAPILVRLAWHDSGTYDHAAQKDWPTCGGANGYVTVL